MTTSELSKSGKGQNRLFSELEDVTFKMLLEKQRAAKLEQEVVSRELQVFFMRLGIAPADELRIDPSTGRHIAIKKVDPSSSASDEAESRTDINRNHKALAKS